MDQVDVHLHEELTHRIIGACMAVHAALGPGHAEEVYQKALELEFEHQEIAFDLQKCVPIHYRDVQVGLRFPDFVLEDKVVLEIKALPALTPLHEAQLIGYFAATEYDVGLLVNFGQTSLQWKRMFPPKKILQKRKERLGDSQGKSTDGTDLIDQDRLLRYELHSVSIC
jgi:GxxExxY protein